MKLWAFERAPLGTKARRASFQLAKQVAPFPLHLAPLDNEPAGPGTAGDAAPIVVVAPPSALLPYRMQVRRDQTERSSRLSKARELGVETIPAGVPAEHRLGEKSFSPEGRESLSVQILWVQRPQAHWANRFRYIESAA